MLQQLVFVNFTSQTSLKKFMHCRFCHAHSPHIVFLILLDCERTNYGQTAFTIASLADRLPKLFRIANPTSLFEKRIPVTGRYFRCRFPTKRRTKSLHSKCRFLFVIAYWNAPGTAMLTPLVARRENSTNSSFRM
jgi:hypothetical protein